MRNLEDNQKAAFTNYGIPLDEFTGRHPSTQHMIKVLAPNVNLKGNLYSIADEFFTLAINLLQECPDGPELTTGLRKLLEAKDCFIRAALDNNPVDYRDR